MPRGDALTLFNIIILLEAVTSNNYVCIIFRFLPDVSFIMK